MFQNLLNGKVWWSTWWQGASKKKKNIILQIFAFKHKYELTITTKLNWKKKNELSPHVEKFFLETKQNLFFTKLFSWSTLMVETLNEQFQDVS